MSGLYHYTCEHGYAAIGDAGYVLTPRQHSPGRYDRLPQEWRWLQDVAWFTDMNRPDRIALGLTSSLTACDRTAYRYRVTDPAHIARWVDVARSYPRQASRLTVGDHMPGRWWVARTAVPVVLDLLP